MKFDIRALRFLALFAVVAVSIVCFRVGVVERVVVSGASMAPTFYSGDVLWTNKLATDYERYDVVVARIDGGAVVKRVIGLPGEDVMIKDGNVFINGVVLAGEPDGVTAHGGIAQDGVVLAGDEYFLLGDNRAESTDSRFFGAVDAEQIKGKVVCQIFPPSRWGTV
jgi:signal peptidase I